MDTPLLFALPGNEQFTEQLAPAVNGEVGALVVREFPDDESYVRVDTDPASHDVVIVSTLRHANEKTLHVVFLADTVRELGARRIGLVAPYLAYMRQDARFHAGEAVTSRSFAGLLSRTVDWLITVEPHLHRFRALDELYTIPATAVHATAAIGMWIAANVASPFIIGPDAESRQWVDGIATSANAPSTVLTKVRRGDADVVESIPDMGDHRACTPVLVDDIISTGQTMVAAVRHLRDTGTAAPVCVAVHAVFAADAYTKLMSAGAARVVTTNTIAHSSNGIDVIPAIADAVRDQRERV
jgi:ribose-phosphate pyrophosphokinase